MKLTGEITGLSHLGNELSVTIGKEFNVPLLSAKAYYIGRIIKIDLNPAKNK